MLNYSVQYPKYFKFSTRETKIDVHKLYWLFQRLTYLCIKTVTSHLKHQ